MEDNIGIEVESLGSKTIESLEVLMQNKQNII